MRTYLQSRWVRIRPQADGGSDDDEQEGGRAYDQQAEADLGPNPIGPGLLFFVTFWPAIVCIVVGVVRVRSRNQARTG